MVGEVAVAFAAHSPALLADAGHMLTDAAALATALWAILSAAVNGVSLVAVAGIVTVEAIQRLLRPVWSAAARCSPSPSSALS